MKEHVETRLRVIAQEAAAARERANKRFAEIQANAADCTMRAYEFAGLIGNLCGDLQMVEITLESLLKVYGEKRVA